MSKRELAIASVRASIASAGSATMDEEASYIVDNLIRDGVINLTYAGNPDISELVDTFQMLFGATATVKTDRFAASRLIKRHGVPYVIGVLEQLHTRKREKFVPVVNNITQLEAKWPQVMRFVQSKPDGETDI